MSNTNDAIPPHDDEAEKAVLGAMLLSGRAIEDVTNIIHSSGDFYRPAHATIYAAMVQLWAADAPCDPVTVANHLVADGSFARIGGGPYLHTLMNVVPAATAGGHYARIVFDRASQRLAVEHAGRLERSVATNDPKVLADIYARMAEESAARHGPVAGQRSGRAVLATAAAGRSIRAARWLWDRRIPSSAISLLTGREGIGKSTISYDIISKVTLGTLPGRMFGSPRGVGIIATEDAWEEVILPRLVASGADLDRVFQIEASAEDGAATTVSVPADLDELTETCRENDIALIVLDPLMSVINGSLDTHKDREVRKALDPLAKFAAEHGIAVLGLIHVNKRDTADPLNSIMASKAFTAVARSVLYCIADPECETEDRYLFGHVKSNLGVKQPTMKYHLIEVKIELDPESVEPGDDAVVTTSRVVWDGEDDRTIAAVMDAPRAVRADSEVTHQIVAWIAEKGCPVPSREIHAAFSDIKRSTFDKHMQRLVERGKLIRAYHGLYEVPSAKDSP